MKTALIIGASSGIGMATAKILSDDGVKVYNASRTPCNLQNVRNFTLDVNNEEDISDVMAKVVEESGGIDYFVYSAGYSMAAPIEYAKNEDVRELMQVNFFGAAASLKAVIPIMRLQGGGRIVFISSIGGILPIAYDAYYSASKAALDMLVKEADVELRPYNIRVSAVQPGGTRTRFTFKRNVYANTEVGDYFESMDSAVQKLAKIEQTGMAAAEVGATVVKTLKASNPQRLIASGLSNKTIKLMKKILPDSVSLYFNKIQYED